MELNSIVLGTVVGVILLGAAIQTFHLFPTFFDKYFDKTASILTVCAILLVVSVLLLQQLLQWNREGFEDANQKPKAMVQWKEMTETYSIPAVCSIKQQIAERLLPVEKEQNKLTETQANERIDKLFPLNCALLDPVSKAKDIDTFFTRVQMVPNTMLIEVYQTAEKAAQLLEKQYNDIQDALQKREGFVDPSVGICSPEITEERRKFLREKRLDEAAQRCLLPEEVPFERKEDIAAEKVKKIQETYDAAMRMNLKKPLLSDLVAKSQDYLKKLEEIKRKAESGQLLTV
jgi:hypothetical protein